MTTGASRVFPFFAGFAILAAAQRPALGQTETIRVVTYNIEDDINGATVPLPGLIAPYNNAGATQLGGVLEGIGEEILGADPAQPIDLLALQETTGNTTTVDPIVEGLTNFYHAPGMYARSPLQAYESDGYVADGTTPTRSSSTRDPCSCWLRFRLILPADRTIWGRAAASIEVVRYNQAGGVVPTPANEFWHLREPLQVGHKLHGHDRPRRRSGDHSQR